MTSHDVVFGSHLSIAGGLANALIEARRLKFDCVQVFTKNQRQWRVPALHNEERDAWLRELHALGWDKPRGPARVVSHASYLINLASPNENIWESSVALFQQELARCDLLRIPLCVVHPGAHMGERGPLRDPRTRGDEFTTDEERGMRRIADALNRIHAQLPAARAITCLETTAGTGTTLGSSFEQLAFIRALVHEPARVAFCIDTCHVTAAGYDMTTPGTAREVLRQFARICGRNLARVVHVNDSVFPVGSRRDRHAHIGEGKCSRCCFQAILRSPSLRRIPKILETPKGETERGVPLDLLNVRRLKRLARPPASCR